MQDPATNGTRQTPASSNRSALLIVFLVVVVDLLGFGIVLPLLPRFAEEYVEELFPGPTGQPMVGLVIGLLMSSFSLMQFLFMPIWGRMSDRIGRRPVLLASLAGSAGFYTLFGFALAIPATSATLAILLLFVARIGGGVVSATIGTAQAVIADSTPPEKRKHGMALIGAAFGLGFTFGPLVGYALYGLPEIEGAVGYAAATLSFLALVLAVGLLPETRPSGMPRDRKWLDWSGIKRALTSAALAPVVLTFFLATLGFGAFEATLSIMLKDFAFTERDSFLVFAYLGFTLLLTQGVIYRRLARRWSETMFIAIGICLMATGVGLLGALSFLVTQEVESEILLLGMFGLGITTAVIGFAFLTPSAQALISRRTAAEQQGEILGVNQSASALARILGPLFGLSLYKLTDTHLLPYALGAGLLLLMLPLIPRIRRG